MKQLKRVAILLMLICLFNVNVVWASDFSWESIYGNQDQSVLLDSDIKSSTDSVHQYGRGEYLAEGSVEIVNYGGGAIYLRADTYSYVYADRILHHIFLDYWDEELNDWMQVGYWEFEKNSEQANGQLSELTTTLTLTGYETGLYYRVRGLHGVEYHDELEACATRTDGVLITD